MATSQGDIGGSGAPFGPSGPGHAPGAVPDPGAVAGSTRALFEDGTFKAITGGGDALTASPLSQFAATTSAQFAGVISNETGTGLVVFNDTPTLVTPALGVATATTVNKVTITAPAASATITVADGKTLTVSNNATVSGTNTGDVANTALTTGDLSQFAATTSAQLRTLLSDETGTGAAVFANGALGAATATTINKLTLTQPATGSTLTIVDGKTLTASNTADVSGTNTGDQTITLTGDVTGTGTSTFAATIGAKKVTLGMMADGTAGNLITYSAAGATAAVATGTSGQALLSNGPGAAPTFQTLPGGGDALTSNGLGQFASTSSASLRTVMNDETGTGALVFAGGALGAATATTINKIALTQPATGSTLTINDGFTLTVSANATVSGTNTGDVANTAVTTGTLAQFAATTSAQLATLLTDETGSGKAVFDTTPTLVTPVLGVASATSIAMGNGNITAAKQVTFNGVVAGGNKTGASPQLADWTAGDIQTITLTGSVTTPTFGAPSGVSRLTLIVVQGGAGSFTMAQPSGVKSAGGTPPTLSTAVGAIDILTYLYDGSTYYLVGSIGFA